MRSIYLKYHTKFVCVTKQSNALDIMTMLVNVLLFIPMYPWVTHWLLLSIQCVMAEVPVHYYGWILHIHDERVIPPTSDLALLFLQSNILNF